MTSCLKNMCPDTLYMVNSRRPTTIGITTCKNTAAAVPVPEADKERKKMLELNELFPPRVTTLPPEGNNSSPLKVTTPSPKGNNSSSLKITTLPPRVTTLPP